MYRILLKEVRHTNIESLVWLTCSENGNVWEVKDIDEALGEYRKLLDTYNAQSIMLVETIPVSIFVDDSPLKPNKEIEQDKDVSVSSKSEN